MEAEFLYSMNKLHDIEGFSPEEALENYQSRSALFTALWELSVLSHRLFNEFNPGEEGASRKKATDLLAAIDSRLQTLAVPGVARKSTRLLTAMMNVHGPEKPTAEWRDFQIAVDEFNAQVASAQVRRVAAKRESFEQIKNIMHEGGEEQVLRLLRELMQNFYSDKINAILERIEQLLLEHRPEVAQEEMSRLVEDLHKEPEGSKPPPETKADASSSPKASEEGGAPAKKILVVDDVPLLLGTVKAILHPHYQVYAAKNYQTALKILNTVAVDLIITDINMPGMDGITLIKVIRSMEAYARTPIVLLTGSADREKVLSSIAAGGNDYLLKPVNGEALLQKIRKYLE